MDNKANDWILSTMANPEFTASLFVNAGLTSDNTSLYERDKYLNSLLIQNSPLFQTNGKFDRAKFNAYYDNAISKYLELAYETSHPETAKAMFSYNNVWVDESKRKSGLDSKDFELKNIYNPDKRKFGVEKIGYISDREFTPAEIAQNEKVWNPETQKWEQSPNDSWLFRNWFDPVALATWDFDADINGNPTNDPSKVYYQKGQPKISEETGTYYYEKLNGKEPYGKLILSPFDILTVDGSAANKYDFFDSDGIDKSFVGTVAKNAMRIVPLFIPYVNSAYIALNIADEMAKVLPIVYKSTFGLLSEDNSFANKIEAFAMQFDNNKVSEKGLENFFNSESLLNLVSDIALQLYEQRWLFTKAPKYFKLKEYDISKKGKNLSELEEATKAKALEYQKLLGDKGLQAMFELGPDEMGAAAFAKSLIWAENYIKDYQNVGRLLSRYFMAGTSSFLAFQDAKEEGASDLEAAALFWGYFSGMYAIMGTDIGEHVLPELRLLKQEIREALKDLARGKLSGETVLGVKAAETTAEKVGLFKRAFDKGAEFAKVMHKRHVGLTVLDSAKSIGANMLAEGVEEVSEELLYDLTKTTFNIISEFSGGTKVTAWDNMFERYGQSFLGGLLGGGVFEAGNVYKIVKPKLEGEQYDPNNMKANQTIIYQLRNGEKKQVMESLNYLYRNKMLGNPNVGSKIKGVDSNGKVLYSEGTESDNLNEAAYRLMLNYINNIETVLNKENMLTSDTSLLRGDGIEEGDVMLWLRYNYLMNSPTVGKLLQDYNNLADEFLKKYNEILTLESSSDDAKRNNPSWQEDMDRAKSELEELRKKREEFFSNENQQYYTGLMLFAANATMAKPFARITFRDFAEDLYKKKFNELTENQRAKAKEKYEEYLLNNANDEIQKGYNLFMKMNKKFGALLTQMGENSKKYVEGRHIFMNSMNIEIEETDPNTGETKPVKVTIPLLYLKMFGSGKLSDEEILEKAKELAQYAHPFDVMRRFMLVGDGSAPRKIADAWIDPSLIPIQGTSDVDFEFVDYAGNPVTLSPEQTQKIIARRRLLELFKNNILTLILNCNGYVDLELTDAIMLIKKELLNISDLIFLGSNIQEDLAQLNIFDLDKFHNGLVSADNLDEQVQSIIDKIDEKINNTATSLIDKLSLNSIKTEFLDIIRRFKESNNELLLLNQEINNLLQNTVTNPIFELLNDLIITTTGQERNVVLLINEAEKRFKLKAESKDITKFLLDGELSYEDFENAILLIELLLSLIRAALTDHLIRDNIMDFNRLMNLISGTNDLGEIDTTAAAAYYNDLELLRSKILFIMLLHNYNSRQALAEQSKLGAKIDLISFNIIGKKDSDFYTTTVGGVTEPKKIGTDVIINDTIEEAIERAHTLKKYSESKDTNIPVEDLIKIAKERLDIENALYDRIQELISKYGDRKVYEVIFQKYANDSSDIGVKTTAITLSMEDSNVDMMGELTYIMSIIGYRSGDFNYHYKNWIDNNSTTIVPLPALKADIQFGWAIAHNQEMLSIVEDILDTLKYSRSPVLNTILLQGVPGAGKTSAVDMILYQMLKAENSAIKTLTVAPVQQQADKLSKDMNVDTTNNQSLDKKGLLDLIGLKESEINDLSSWDWQVEKDGSGNVTRVNRTLKLDIIDNFKDPNGLNYIFIDEITFFTASELYAIGEYCKKNGILLITSGDLNQGGSLKIFNNIQGVTIIDTIDIVMIPSPWLLTCSMRPSNTAKRDNNNISTIIAETYSWSFLNGRHPQSKPGITIQEVLDHIKENVLTNKKFVGSIDDSGVKGDVLLERPETTGSPGSTLLTDLGKLDLLRVLKLLISNLEPGETIAYVYDLGDTSIKEFIENSGSLTPEERSHLDLINSIDFFLSKDIQGSERKYCIIDINWDEQFYSLFNLDNPLITDDDIRQFEEDLRRFIGFVKTLNTVISRSINGSIIFNNGLSYLLGKDSFQTVDSDLIKDIKPSPEMLLTYSDTLKAIQESTMQGYTPTATTTPPGPTNIHDESYYRLSINAIDVIADLENLKNEIQSSTLEDSIKQSLISDIDTKIARISGLVHQPTKTLLYYLDQVENTDDENDLNTILLQAIADGYTDASSDPDLRSKYLLLKLKIDDRTLYLVTLRLNAEVLSILNAINSCTTISELDLIQNSRIVGKTYLETNVTLKNAIELKRLQILNGIFTNEVLQAIDTINSLSDYDTAKIYYDSLDDSIQQNQDVKEALENKKLSLNPGATTFIKWEDETLLSMTLQELLDNKELLDKIENALKLGSPYSVSVIKYNNLSSYNRYKNSAYKKDDRFTSTNIQSLQELLTIIENSRVLGPFSILFTPIGGTSGKKRSDFEKIHITTKQQIHEPPIVYKKYDWFETKEGENTVYYTIIGTGKDSNGLTYYYISKVTNLDDPSTDQKLPHSEKAYIFNTRGYKKLERSPRGRKRTLPAASGEFSMESTKARKFTFVTPNEIANLIERDGDLGMKMYTGLTTQSSVKLDSSGKIVLMGTLNRNYDLAENLDAILAPFVTVKVIEVVNGTLQLVQKQYDPLTQCIITDDKGNLVVYDRKSKQLIGTCLTTNIPKDVYDEALNVLTTIKSALININATSGQQQIIKTITASLVNFYTKRFGAETAIQLTRQLIPQNSGIDYTLKLFNESGVDTVIDNPVFANASQNFKLLPRRIFAAKIGNFELHVAKIANPETLFKYYHSVVLMRNYLINTGLLLRDSDDDKKLIKSINRIEKLSSLAYRLNYLTNRSTYHLPGGPDLGKVLGDGKVLYIPIPSLLDLSTGRLTGSLIYNTEEASDDYLNEGIPYNEFISLPGIIHSEPVILTDVIKNKNLSTNMSTRGGMPEIISGKPMIVYSMNLLLYCELIDGHWYVNNEDRGEKVTNDNIFIIWRDAYTRLLQGGCTKEAKEEYNKQLKNAIGFIVASPKSTNFSTYVNTTIALVNNLIKSKKAGRVLLGNLTTGTRLIHTLFNIQADLLEALNNGTLSQTFYIGSNPEQEANGKIVLTKDNAERISESLNKLLYTLVNRVLSKGKAELISTENKDKLVGRECWQYPENDLNPYGLVREKADRSEEAIKKLRKGILTLIKSTCTGITIKEDIDDELFNLPYSINTGGTRESIDILGDFSENNTWKAVPFALAQFFGATSFTGDNSITEIVTLDDIFSGNIATSISPETIESNKLLLEFLDNNLTLYGKNPEALSTLSSRNPLNLGIFYNSAYEPIDISGRDTVKEIAYPADSSFRDNYRFTAVVQTPSLHLSAELTDLLYSDVESEISLRFPLQIESTAPVFHRMNNWWLELEKLAIKEFSENINMDPLEMPISPIMGAAQQSLTPELKKEKLIADAVHSMKFDTDKLSIDDTTAIIDSVKQIINRICELYPREDTPLKLLFKTLEIINNTNLSNKNLESILLYKNTSEGVEILPLKVGLNSLGFSLVLSPEAINEAKIINNTDGTISIKAIVTKNNNTYSGTFNLNRGNYDLEVYNANPESDSDGELPPPPGADIIPGGDELLVNIPTEAILNLLNTVLNILKTIYVDYDDSQAILKVDPNKLLMDILNLQFEDIDSYNQVMSEYKNLYDQLEDSLKEDEPCTDKIGDKIVWLRGKIS